MKMYVDIIVIFVLLFVCAIWWLYRYISHKNINVRKPGWKDNVLALILMLASVALSSYKVGEHYNRGVWYGEQSGKFLQINFTQPQSVKTIKLFGCFVNGNFSMYYLDANGKNGIIQNVDNTKNPRTACTWFRYPTHLSQPVVALNLVINKPLLEVMKVYLESSNGLPVVNYTPSAKIDHNLDNMAGIFFNDRLVSPNYKNTGMLFDENDYALMAYHYLNSVPVFNLSHPQLAILMMTIPIKYLGMNPFSWRLFSILCGAFVVGIIYFFAKELFDSRGAGVVASCLLILDFMHFTINRMAIIEPYVTLFLLMEYYCLWQYHCNRVHDSKRAFNNLFLTSILLGICVACKWSGLFSIPVVLIVVIYNECKYFYKNQIKYVNVIDLVVVALLPILIYIASYIPLITMLQSPNLFKTVWSIQQEMFTIHTQLAVTNAVEGQAWWSWPLNRYLMTIYFMLNYKSGAATSMVLMGNPLIWWLGIPAILFLVATYFKNKSKEAAFILLVIFAQYLPYAFMKRVSFIYYFYSVSPFWILAITWLLYSGWLRKESSYKWYTILYLILCLAVFVLFYPAIAGIEVHRSYIFKYLLWFNTWKF